MPKSQRITVAAVVAIAVVVIGVVVAVSMGGDGDHDTAAPPSTESEDLLFDIAQSELAKNFTLPETVPEGDYGPFCAEVARQNEGLGGGAGFNQVVEWYRSLDFTKLEAVAPPGFVSTLQDLENSREEVTATFDQVDSVAALDEADLPEPFITGLEALVKVGLTKCQPTSSAATTTSRS